MERNALEILLCRISGQRYGIALSHVREVLRAIAITPVPGAPRLLEGLINLRGETVPVIDVRARFALPASETDPADHIIVVRAGERLMAIRVDCALEVSSIEFPDAAGSENMVPLPKYVDGVATLDTGLAVVFDATKFLSWAEEQIVEALRAERLS